MQTISFSDFEKSNHFKSFEIQEARWLIYNVDVNNRVSTIVAHFALTAKWNLMQMKFDKSNFDRAHLYLWKGILLRTLRISVEPRYQISYKGCAIWEFRPLAVWQAWLKALLLNQVVCSSTRSIEKKSIIRDYLRFCKSDK